MNVSKLPLCSLLWIFSLSLYAEPSDGAAEGEGVVVVKKSKRSEAARKGARRGLSEKKHRELESKAFKAADKNANGALDFREFSSLDRLARLDEEKRQRIFDFLDKNRDTFLTQEELLSDRPRRPAVTVKFKRLDINANGSLDLDEFMGSKAARGMSVRRAKHHFKRLDVDGNGHLNMREWAHLRPGPRMVVHFKKSDTDNNGNLSYEEYAQVPFINRLSAQRRRKLFARIDRNNNGQLSYEEVGKASRRPPRGKRHHEGEPPRQP